MTKTSRQGGTRIKEAERKARGVERCIAMKVDTIFYHIPKNFAKVINLTAAVVKGEVNGPYNSPHRHSISLPSYIRHVDYNTPLTRAVTRHRAPEVSFVLLCLDYSSA